MATLLWLCNHQHDGLEQPDQFRPAVRGLRQPELRAPDKFSSLGAWVSSYSHNWIRPSSLATSGIGAAKSVASLIIGDSKEGGYCPSN